MCRGAALGYAYMRKGKAARMPCHHNFDEYLHAYINDAKLTEGKSILFCTRLVCGSFQQPPKMSQADAYRMIRRGPPTLLSLRRSAITPSMPPALRIFGNGGKLEIAQQMAAHERARHYWSL